MNIVEEAIEKILLEFTREINYEDLKSAKAAFINKTGDIDEDAAEYESRMNSFNDWYLFNYQRANGTKIIDNCDPKIVGDKDLLESIQNAKYSIFLFQKTNFRKQIVIKDILHSEKFTLATENGTLSLFEGDLFIGRSVTCDNKTYLTHGLCTLPSEVLPALKKESKKIRKLNNSDEEEAFLLNLERLKTRSLQYGHIDAAKIFTF
ncbi:MAG: hypothetical protein HON90_01390 [Halobacteriovoraceae bacterium]|jgi:hypothetical protein|nr:hypothetical protein [Halobacteriovoraceae bacterium]